MSRRIDLVGCASTEQWVRWAPMTGEAVADAVADAVTTTPEARASVAAWIRATDLGLREIQGVVDGAGWVPEPTGGVVALMVSSILRGEPGLDAAAYEKRSARAKAPRGVKMFGRSVTSWDLPLGRGVVEVEISASRGEPTVDHSIIWTVFPRDVADAVRLHFRTPHSELLELLADEARIMVENIEFTTVETA
jgi:hypothetical protein